MVTSTSQKELWRTWVFVITLALFSLALAIPTGIVLWNFWSGGINHPKSALYLFSSLFSASLCLIAGFVAYGSLNHPDKEKRIVAYFLIPLILICAVRVEIYIISRLISG